MDNELIAVSPQMQEVKKLISLVRGISVNTIIMGDEGVGKSMTARLIVPNAIVVSGRKPEDVIKALKNFDEVIIEDFDKLPNSDSLHIDGKKIVATSRKKIKDSTLDKVFGIKIDIDPLVKRQEDIVPLTSHFISKAQKELEMYDVVITSDDVAIDVSKNCHTLKRAAYQALLCASLDEEQLGGIMESYFYAKLDESDDNYKRFLDIFDSAIINANHKMYKSQLMMSYKMGINRNTLRKKILQLGKKLTDE